MEAALRDGGVVALQPARRGTAIAPTPAGAPLAALAQPMPDDKILALYEKGSYEVLPHDGMRKVIAQRLTLSKQTIPHFYLTVDCRLDELLRARERMNATAPKEGPRAYKLSVNDFLIKALALALAQDASAPVVKQKITDATEAAKSKVGGGSNSSDPFPDESLLNQEDPYPRGNLP